MYHQYHERWSHIPPATDEIKKILDDLEESLYESYLKRNINDDDEEDDDDSDNVIEYILSRLIGKNNDENNNISSVCTSVTLCTPLQKKYIIEPLLDPNNPWTKPYTLKDQFDGNKLWRHGSFYTFIIYCILAVAMWAAHLIVVAFSNQESDILNGTNNDCASVFYLTIGNLIGFTLAPFLLLLIWLVLYTQTKLQSIYTGFIECFEMFDINTCLSNIMNSIFHPSTPKNVVDNSIQNDTIHPTENLSINVNIHKNDPDSNPNNLRQLTLKSLNMASPATYPSTEYSTDIKINIGDPNNLPDNKNNISSVDDIKIDTLDSAESLSACNNLPSVATTTTGVSIGIIENTQPPVLLSRTNNSVALISTSDAQTTIEAPSYIETLFRIMRQDEGDTQNLTEEELRYRKSIEWAVLVLMVLLALDIFCFTVWNLVSPYFLALDASQNCQRTSPDFYRLQVATSSFLYICSSWLIFFYICCQTLSCFGDYNIFLSNRQIRYREDKARSDKIDRDIAEESTRFKNSNRILLLVPPDVERRDFLELLCQFINEGQLPGLHLVQFSGLKENLNGKKNVPENNTPFNEGLLQLVLNDCFKLPPPSPLSLSHSYPISIKPYSRILTNNNNNNNNKLTEDPIIRPTNISLSLKKKKLRVSIPSVELGVIKEERTTSENVIDVKSNNELITLSETNNIHTNCSSPVLSSTPTSSSSFHHGKAVLSSSCDILSIGPDLMKCIWEFIGPNTLMQCLIACRYWVVTLAPHLHVLFLKQVQTMTKVIGFKNGLISSRTAKSPSIRVSTPGIMSVFEPAFIQQNAVRGRTESALLPVSVRKALLNWDKIFRSNPSKCSSPVREIKIYDTISRKMIQIIRAEVPFDKPVIKQSSSAYHVHSNTKQFKPSLRFNRIVQESLMSSDIKGTICLGNSLNPLSTNAITQYGNYVRYLLDTCCSSIPTYLASLNQKPLLTTINNKDDLLILWSRAGYPTWQSFASDAVRNLASLHNITHTDPETFLNFCQLILSISFPSLILAINDNAGYDSFDVLNMFIAFWQILIPQHKHRWRQLT